MILFSTLPITFHRMQSWIEIGSAIIGFDMIPLTSIAEALRFEVKRI